MMQNIDLNKNKLLKKKSKKNKYLGGNSYDYNTNGAPFIIPDNNRRRPILINGQNQSELSQFGSLPGSDFSQTVGRPLGATGQLMADSTGPGTGGGKIIKRNKSNSRKNKHLGGNSYDYNTNGAPFINPDNNRRRPILINGQNQSELSQFGSLPGSDFSQTVGRPLGATGQLMADSTGPGTGGGKKKKGGEYSLSDINTTYINLSKWPELQNWNSNLDGPHSCQPTLIAGDLKPDTNDSYSACYAPFYFKNNKDTYQSEFSKKYANRHFSNSYNGGSVNSLSSDLNGVNYYDIKNVANFDLKDQKINMEKILKNNDNRYLFPAFFSQYD